MTFVTSASPTAVPPRILIVDADADSLSRYQEAFERAGCDVVSAGDGHRALMRALEQPPALVLTDVDLPLLDGAALCDVLMRDRVTADVPILLVTDAECRIDRERPRGLMILRKPASVDDVLRESRRLITQSMDLGVRAGAVKRQAGAHVEQTARLRAEFELRRQTVAEARANRVLASLPPEDYQRLHPLLTSVPMRAKRVVRARDEPLRQVLFPTGGVCGIVGVVDDGAMVECSAVGDEGMVGIEAFLTDRPTPFGEVIVQVSGPDAMALSVAEFRREIARGGALQSIVAHYLEAALFQLKQHAVCSALHHVEQRCARWLLTTQDRTHHHEFGLSHEFLALMLGVQRPTVTAAAGMLQKAGFIRYTHGRVSIQNRAGLERASCECYQVIRARFQRLAA